MLTIKDNSYMPSHSLLLIIILELRDLKVASNEDVSKIFNFIVNTEYVKVLFILFKSKILSSDSHA